VAGASPPTTYFFFPGGNGAQNTIFINNGATRSGDLGGATFLYSAGDFGKSKIVNYGGTTAGARGGYTECGSSVLPAFLTARVVIYYGLKKWDLMAVVANKLAEWNLNEPANFMIGPTRQGERNRFTSPTRSSPEGRNCTPAIA
jgi:hypothetical protein